MFKYLAITSKAPNDVAKKSFDRNHNCINIRLRMISNRVPHRPKTSVTLSQLVSVFWTVKKRVVYKRVITY